MEPRSQAQILIIRISVQPFKKEIKLKLQILPHRLAYQGPDGSSRKRGNRGGAMTSDKAGHLGARIYGDNGTIRHPNLKVMSEVMLDVTFFPKECESACVLCVP